MDTKSNIILTGTVELGGEIDDITLMTHAEVTIVGVNTSVVATSIVRHALVIH